MLNESDQLFPNPAFAELTRLHLVGVKVSLLYLLKVANILQMVIIKLYSATTLRPLYRALVEESWYLWLGSFHSWEK